MTPYPNQAPALTSAGHILPSVPSVGRLRSAAGVCAAELAVLLIRGSAAVILLSPALAAVFLLAG